MKRVIALSMLVLSLPIASPLWAQEGSQPVVPSVKEGCDPGIAEIVGPKRFEKDCLAFLSDHRFASFKKFETDRYTDEYIRGGKLRTAGIVLISAGSAALIASVFLVVRGYRLIEEGDMYVATHGMKETFVGLGLGILGEFSLGAGIGMLIPGIRMRKRAEAALDYLHQKPTAPIAFTGMNLAVVRDGVGFGMTLSF